MCGVVVIGKGQSWEQWNTTCFPLVSHQRSLKQREIKYQVLISEPEKVQSSNLALISACPCLQGRAGNLERKNMLSESVLVKLAQYLHFIHNSATDLMHLYSSKKRVLFFFFGLYVLSSLYAKKFTPIQSCNKANPGSNTCSCCSRYQVY